MARIFITGSADGIGLMEARMLVSEGHEVVVHGRSRQRADEALAKVPGAVAAVAGDLACIAETKSLADRVNELGPFDAVIHNAGVYHEPRLVRTVDHLPRVFAVNSLASLYPDLPDQEAEAPGLYELGHASKRRRVTNRPDLERPAMVGIGRLLGF